MVAAEFSANDRKVITTGDDCVRFWDATTGDQVGRRDIGETPTTVLLSKDGRRLLTTGPGRVKIYALPPANGEKLPHWVYEDFAMCLSGKFLGASGTVLEKSPEECLSQRDKLRERRADKTDPFSVWLNWLLKDSRTRSISPWLSITVPDLVEREVLNAERTGGDASSDLLRLSPTHPLVFFYLAEGPEELEWNSMRDPRHYDNAMDDVPLDTLKPTRLNFLRDYGLHELERADISAIYGSKRVARYALEAAKILL